MEPQNNLNISDSILTLTLKNGCFCSAYSAFIVFGPISKHFYENHKCLVFERRIYHLFFTTLLQIAKALSGQSDNKTAQIVQKNSISYWWSLEDNDLINFCIKQENVTLCKFSFTLSEINDFTIAVHKLILPSMHLKYCEAQLLIMCSNCTANDIKGFSSKDNCKNFILKHLKVDEWQLEIYCVLMTYNRDIIMLLHKLNSLISPIEEEIFFALIAN